MADKLAIDGGPEAVTNNLAAWPSFDEKAIKAVEDVLRSGKVNYWTGPKGMEFEKQFAAWQGSKYAISASTGTSALHIALSALGIGPGDEVIVPSYTFIASSFSVVQAAAIPRELPGVLPCYNLAPKSPNMEIEQLERLGYALAVYPGICFTTTMLACEAALAELRAGGLQANLHIWRERFDEWNRFLADREGPFAERD